MVQARARALSEDEKAIAPGYQDIGIPRGKTIMCPTLSICKLYLR